MLVQGERECSSSDVAQGIIWAADHGARVINLSLGGGPSPGMQTAMQYARTKQVVTFAAAGNSYQDGIASWLDLRLH